jgi:amidase
MTQTVRDAALVIGAMAGSDPADAATVEADAHKIDYAAALTGKVVGVRIGVLRGEVGDDPATQALFDAALATLKAQGAVLVDIAAVDAPKGLDDAETKVLMTELKADLNAYLSTTPPTVKTRTLAEIIAFNRANASREMPLFGQETFLVAEATKGLDDPDYLKALATSRDGARATLTQLLTDKKVAMLVAPTTGPAWFSDPVGATRGDGPSASGLPAVAGYPHLTVPMGQVRGLPVGLSFIGPAWSEALLLNAGDAFEAARGRLPPPSYAASVVADFDPAR